MVNVDCSNEKTATHQRLLPTLPAQPALPGKKNKAACSVEGVSSLETFRMATPGQKVLADVPACFMCLVMNDIPCRLFITNHECSQSVATTMYFGTVGAYGEGRALKEKSAAQNDGRLLKASGLYMIVGFTRQNVRPH